MKRFLLLLLFLLGSLSRAQGEPWEPPKQVATLLIHSASQKKLGGGSFYTLAEVLEVQRKSYPSAQVTSGFLDPRGVSRYRGQAGLHLGYDIAMPYGALVYCVWPGRVEAVIPWHGTEVGVRVRHSDGTSATYGHVHALARPGQTVAAGQVLASIASDHLDLKMRDAGGAPLDFGAGRSVPRDVRARWLGATLRWLQIQEQLRDVQAQLANWNESRIKAPRPSPEAIPVYLEKGILSPQQAQRVLQQHRRYQLKLSQGSIQQNQLRGELQRLQGEVTRSQSECARLYQEAGRAGYSWSQALAYLETR